MKRHWKRIILIGIAWLLLFGGFSVASAAGKDAKPVSLAKKCTYRTSAEKSKYTANWLSDRKESTRIALHDGDWVTLTWKKADVDFVYFEWTDKDGVEPAPYTVQLLDVNGKTLETREGERYWNCGFAVSKNVHGVRLTAKGTARLCTLIPFSGGAPEDYHPWKPTVEKADFLVIAMHPDDDVLFMGNVIATYGMQKKYAGTILYLATRTRVRRTEALNGAWIMGQRTYPLMAGLADISMKNREKLQQNFQSENVERVLVRYLRRLKPEVVVTHDDNGEYGHWQHIVVAQTARKAVVDAVDPHYDPDSAKQFGVWQVKKLYLHLAQQNPIFLSATVPLSAFGGRTALEVAQQAYQCHQSQRLWRHPCNNQNENSLERFGLVFTTVGADTGSNDLFEHIVQNAAEPSPQPNAASPARRQEFRPVPIESRLWRVD